MGAVLLARRAGTVLKVTIDGTECLLDEAMRVAGIRKALPPYVVEPLRVDYRGESMWLLWRKDTPPPNLRDARDQLVSLRDVAMGGEDEADRLLFEGARTKREIAWAKRVKLDQEFHLGEFDELAALNQAGLCYALSTGYAMGKGLTMREAIRRIQAVMPWAQKQFDPEYTGGYSGWQYTRDRREHHFPDSVAVCLLAFEFHLQRLAVGKIMPELAQSLLGLLEAGVICCDIQADNISAAGPISTLFDGGFTLPTDDRWLDFWDHIGARTDRWSDHNLRYRAWDVFMHRDRS